MKKIRWFICYLVWLRGVYKPTALMLLYDRTGGAAPNQFRTDSNDGFCNSNQILAERPDTFLSIFFTPPFNFFSVVLNVHA